MQCINSGVFDLQFAQTKVFLQYGVQIMSKFQIPKRSPTTNKTVRFPNDVIESVENAIQGSGCSFSEFVIAAVRNALEELKEQGDTEG